MTVMIPRSIPRANTSMPYSTSYTKTGPGRAHCDEPSHRGTLKRLNRQRTRALLVQQREKYPQADGALPIHWNAGTLNRHMARVAEGLEEPVDTQARQ